MFYPFFAAGSEFFSALALVTLYYLTDKITLGNLLGAASLTVPLRINIAKSKQQRKLETAKTLPLKREAPQCDPLP